MKIRGKIVIKKKHKTGISKELHKHDKCWGKKQNKTLHFVTQAQICQNCDTHIHHHHTKPINTLNSTHNHDNFAMLIHTHPNRESYPYI